MKCPACRSKEVHLSHPRSSREKFYRHLFRSNFYRCHTCGWRGSVSSLMLQSVLGVENKRMMLVVLAAVLALILLEVFILLRTEEHEQVGPPSSRLGTTTTGRPEAVHGGAAMAAS